MYRKNYETMQILITLQDVDCENSINMNAVYIETKLSDPPNMNAHLVILAKLFSLV